MRYEILGPPRITDRESREFVNAKKIEAIFVVLVIRSNQTVTPDELIFELWADEPPRRATAGLHVHISQLRKFLQWPHRSNNPIFTRPTGYKLSTGNDEVDFHLFLELVNQGRHEIKQRRFTAASGCFEKAIRLWRGGGLDHSGRGPITTGFATRMTEIRLECYELLADAYLELGRHRELVGSLYSLIAEHPLHEAFYRQLMMALYRSERQADALNVYQVARTTLNEELGLEPGPALRDLQQAILAANTGSAVPILAASDTVCGLGPG